MRRLMFFGDDNKSLLSMLMIVIGLVLAIWPGHVMTTAITVLGIAMMVGGGILLWSWYRGRDRGEADLLTLPEAILLLVGGLFVLTRPKFLISIIPTLVGLAVLLNGFVNLKQALDQKRHYYNRWRASMAMAILTLILGALVLFNPFSTMEVLVMAIGAVLIYNGASNLFILSGFHTPR